MKRSALTTLVAVGLAAATLVSTACATIAPVLTQSVIDDATSAVHTSLQISPNPIDFGLSTTTIDVQLRLSSSIQDGFSIESLESVPTNAALSTDVGTCKPDSVLADVGSSCTLRVGLDRSVSGTPTSGTGTLRATMRVRTDKNFLMIVDIPYTWGNDSSAPTTSVATTDAPTTAAPTTEAPTTVAATTPPTPPAISVSPTAHNFGSVQDNAAMVPFTVTNTGGGSLRFASFRLGTGNAEFFYVGGNSCQGASLAAGQSCVISVGVGAITSDTSPGPGGHADTLTIKSNGGDATISLSYTTPAPG